MVKYCANLRNAKGVSAPSTRFLIRATKKKFGTPEIKP